MITIVFIVLATLGDMGDSSTRKPLCPHGKYLHSQDQQCYDPTEQGPCATGEWLIPDSFDRISCQKRLCAENEIFFSGKCQNEEDIICETGERLLFDKRGNVECSCEEGFVRRDGICYQPFSRGWCTGDKILLIPSSNQYLTDSSCTANTRASTEEKKCVFPFSYRGEWYAGCTNTGLQNDEGYWCPTSPLPNQGPGETGGEWGLCSQNCHYFHNKGSVLFKDQASVLIQAISNNSQEPSCQDNPCGNPKKFLPHITTWNGSSQRPKCHPVEGDLSKCENTVLNREGNIVCFQELVLLSIVTKKHECGLGRTWSRFRKMCVSKFGRRRR